MSATLNRTTLGLVFRDDFNRANGGPGANYTSFNGPTAAIVSNALALTGINAEGRLRVTGAGSSFLKAYVQVLASLPSTSGADMGICVLDVSTGGGIGTTYDFQCVGGEAQMWVFGGGYTKLAGVSFSPGTTQHRYGVFAQNGAQKGWADGVLKVSTTDTSFGGSYTGSVSLRVTGNGLTTTYDDLIICSDYRLTVTGLPTGWKVQAKDGGGAVVAGPTTESGGTATLDCSPAALPFASLEVLDSSNGVQGSYSGEVWGGDVWVAAAASLEAVPMLLNGRLNSPLLAGLR